ncbi:HAD family hydrolase [Bacillus sp. FJAT-45350]|uniref:HAD family hydrolase n=1 Tax=Bacillus sp. FJAT-45350 TaxID=2011014 RepID=UPI000BB98518|nr:HAD family hydrolase [Bacillus sp. FJAT-45350]
MIKAVIFDCDGLLIDTETPWYWANKELYQQYDIDLPLELYAKCIGNPTFEDFHPYEYLKEKGQLKIETKELQKKAGAIHKRIMSTQELRQGVIDYLEEAKKLGVKIGLASSSNEAWVLNLLNRFDILGYFDTICTGDMVERAKPYPDLYEAALKNLQVNKHEAIAFEDSVNGLLAAKAAGLSCVIVPNEATSVLTFENHDFQIESMSDMSLKEIFNEIDVNGE